MAQTCNGTPKMPSLLMNNVQGNEYQFAMHSALNRTLKRREAAQIMIRKYRLSVARACRAPTLSRVVSELRSCALLSFLWHATPH
jgi:hypothetical protein